MIDPVWVVKEVRTVSSISSPLVVDRVNFTITSDWSLWDEAKILNVELDSFVESD